MQTIHGHVLTLNKYLGYDFNTVEFAVRDGIPYAIDFCNPAPDAEVTSVGQENFDWVVEYSALYAIERARTQVDGKDNLTWGEYIKTSAAGTPLVGATAGSAKGDMDISAIAPIVKTRKKASAKAPAKK
jgi:hypothetical protein